MNTPPQMPQFGQAPIIGQRQQQIRTQVHAAIGQLSMGIYSQLATCYLSTQDMNQSIDQDQLRKLAKYAQVAGKCYFEGLGVIEQEKGDPQ
jgi:hypothetical protein